MLFAYLFIFYQHAASFHVFCCVLFVYARMAVIRIESFAHICKMALLSFMHHSQARRCRRGRSITAQKKRTKKKKKEKNGMNRNRNPYQWNDGIFPNTHTQTKKKKKHENWFTNQILWYFSGYAFLVCDIQQKTWINGEKCMRDDWVQRQRHRQTRIWAFCLKLFNVCTEARGPQSIRSWRKGFYYTLVCI